MKRWLLVLGGGALVLTIVLNGVDAPVFAQDDTATPAAEDDVDLRQAYLDSVAAQLGITREELEAAMTAAGLEMIDLWAEQARDRVGQGEPLFPNMGGGGALRIFDRLHGGLADRGIFGGMGHGRSGEGFAALVTFLGITEGELRENLESGMSFVEIAEANGKTYDDLRTYMIEKATERIDEALEQSAGEPDETTGAGDTSVSVEVA